MSKLQCNPVLYDITKKQIGRDFGKARKEVEVMIMHKRCSRCQKTWTQQVGYEPNDPPECDAETDDSV